MKLLPIVFAPIFCATVAALAVVDTKVPAQPPGPPCCKEGLPPAKFSEKSLYSLDATWTADVEREVKLSALGGRPQVMALFFTGCEHSCPLIVQDMKAIQAALPANLRDKVDFLLVSIDPARDSTDALKAFRAKHGLEIKHWSLLRGEAESVKQLAEMAGFRYMPGSNFQYAHSLLISVLNESGEIVFQASGVGNAPDGAVKTLLQLVKSPAKAKRALPAK